MNILITFLTAKVNTFGGVEKSIFSLIDGLRKTNNNVYVYTSQNGDHLDNFYYSQYLNCNFDCAESEIDNNIRKLYENNGKKINDEIESIILKNKIDYILIIDQLWGIIPSINFKNIYNVKMGILYHMTYQMDLIYKTLNMNFDNYFAVSSEVKEMIIKANKTSHNIDVLPNCFVEDEFNEFNNKEKNYIFCNCRLAEGKGIENLLITYKKVAKKYPDLKLYLCGGKFHFGKQEKILDYINNFLKDNNFLKKNIVMLDNLDWSEIPGYIKDSKLVVLPTQYESFGIAALESIACCKPLITMSVGNLPCLVKNSGILLEYGDNTSLYNSIVDLIEDSKLRNNLIQNCKIVRKEYTSVNVARKLLGFIER
jgi:glycosyltransferase involved in cell wall biosynthesis